MATITSNRLSDTPQTRFKQRMLRVEARDTLPITMRHERIYILPTKRGLAFLGVVLVMIMASMNYGLNLGYALSFMMVGLFASCLLSTYMNLTQLRVQSARTTDSYAGQALEFTIKLTETRNRTRHSITVSTDGAHNRVDIKANTSNVANLRVKGHQRGLINLGRITLSSDFPLGLWRGWGYVHAPITAYVYPHPETDAPALADDSSEQGDALTTQSGEREFKQLKRYQETDSPGSVAWKQVAKGGSWYSKEFEPEYKNKSSTIRWKDTPSLATTEQRLSRMCAWVQSAEASATPYSFEMPGITRNRQHGPAHLKECLRHLAAYNPDQIDGCVAT